MNKYAYILNLINVPHYASKRGIPVEHEGSRRDCYGTTWQQYRIGGGRWWVRCQNSNFNNLAKPIDIAALLSLPLPKLLDSNLL